MNTEAATLEQIQLEDFHNARRLVIGCPVYGRFYGPLNALHVHQILEAAAPAVSTVKYTSGYFDPRTGGFSPYPTPRPA